VIIVDGETSGLRSKRCQMLDVTLVHLRSASARTWWIAEEEGREFETGAIRVNGLTLQSLREDPRRQPLGTVLAEMYRWVRGLVPGGSVLWVGRNPGFDLRFLGKGAKRWLRGAEAAFFQQLLGHRILDTHSLVFGLALAHGWPVHVDKVDELYARLGLEAEPKPHTSEGGAWHCYAGLERALRAIRDGGVMAADVESEKEDLR
jgi:hypothetical protein